ncbi:MAG: bacteriophage Gp15 family protein [Clostridia bacterium]|nr:bacteriophage Gp15 family protein [Clostridia bacterium]
MIGELPKSLTVNNADYDIRTDFRDILNILCAFSDPELTDEEKVYVCLYTLYRDFDSLPESDYEAAFKGAINFIDYGAAEDGGKKKSPRVMDWEQDEMLLFSAVNKVAGFETRSAEYLHWWTFMGYYMEISDGLYAQILSLRSKKAKNKKFEKWETEFWRANKDLCVLRPKLSEEEKRKKERLNALLG